MAGGNGHLERKLLTLRIIYTIINKIDKKH
jgi:hypothetical protein